MQEKSNPRTTFHKEEEMTKTTFADGSPRDSLTMEELGALDVSTLPEQEEEDLEENLPEQWDQMSPQQRAQCALSPEEEAEIRREFADATPEELNEELWHAEEAAYQQKADDFARRLMGTGKYAPNLRGAAPRTDRNYEPDFPPLYFKPWREMTADERGRCLLTEEKEERLLKGFGRGGAFHGASPVEISDTLWSNESIAREMAQKQRPSPGPLPGMVVGRPPRTAYTSSDLVTAEIPPIRSLVPSLGIPVGGSLILSGPPGSGKSWLALEIATSLGWRGTKFMNHEYAPYAHVLYVDQENSVASLASRHKALRAGHGIQPSYRVYIFFDIKGGWRLDNDGNIDELINIVLAKDIDVLVIDALVRFHSGDENSARDMAVVTRNLTRLMAATGIAIIVVHHTRKQFPGTPRAESLRGSSELMAWPDTVWRCDRRGDGFIMKCLKNRHGELPPDFGWRLEEEGEGIRLVREEGVPLDFFGRRQEEATDAVLDLLADGELHLRKELLEDAGELGFGRPTVEATLRALVDEGRVELKRLGSSHAFRLKPVQGDLEM